MLEKEFKSYRAEVKAAPSGDAGVVEALVSVFGNVDLGGDRLVQGAFTKSLEKWAASGDPLPFIWSHEWDNPDAHIGYVVKAEERPEGLWVQAKLDIDRPFAEQVFHLMKNRRVTQFSFGYTVDDYKMVTDPDGKPVRELRAVDIFEAGPTLLGMNPATQLLEAASALNGNKGGKSLADLNESGHPVTPRQAALYDALEGVVEVFGKFDQSTGSEGAHYVPESPFAGLNCSSCIFYEGPRGCEIVDGDIAPEAVCKFWTIPNDLLAAPQVEAASATDAIEEKTADDTNSEVEETSDNASRDTDATINHEQVFDLLVRTRHSEE